MRIVAVILYTLYAILYTSHIVHAESLTVSLQVGTTQVMFSGYTSPDSFVVIKEAGNVVGTTSSNSLGNWSTIVTVAIPSIHTYTISSTDTQSRQTSSIEYSLNVIGNTTTNIEHIVIPPTISLSSTVLSGATYPSSTLTITISNGDTATINPNSAGNWSYDLASLAYGSYTITASTSVLPSYLSLESNPISYIATAPSPTPSPQTSASNSSSPSTSNPPSTQSPTPAPTLSPSPSPRPFFVNIYDTNSDGRLTTPELFDIIKAWLRKLLICDLNHDARCNLTDLSILLYYIDR